MVMNAATNDTSALGDRSCRREHESKLYRPPTLKKLATLAAITAADGQAISGVSNDNVIQP
jgi:hypothetical protein